MRRAIVAVAACAGLLALSAPAASADVVNEEGNVCTGTAEWNVNLPAAYADVLVTSSTCKDVTASVEDNGNPHLNVNDESYTGGYRLNLLGVTVTGTNSFVGAGYADGLSAVAPHVEVVSPGILNATVVGSRPTPDAGTEEHVGIESCGTNCYRTQIRWIHTYPEDP